MSEDRCDVAVGDFVYDRNFEGGPNPVLLGQVEETGLPNEHGYPLDFMVGGVRRSPHLVGAVCPPEEAVPPDVLHVLHAIRRDQSGTGARQPMLRVAREVGSNRWKYTIVNLRTFARLVMYEWTAEESTISWSEDEWERGNPGISDCAREFQIGTISVDVPKSVESDIIS